MCWNIYFNTTSSNVKTLQGIFKHIRSAYWNNEQVPHSNWDLSVRSDFVASTAPRDRNKRLETKQKLKTNTNDSNTTEAFNLTGLMEQLPKVPKYEALRN